MLSVCGAKSLIIRELRGNSDVAYKEWMAVDLAGRGVQMHTK